MDNLKINKMIQANELRIGNLVHSIPRQKVFQVSIRTLRNLQSGKSYIEPIHITELWLFSFGFEQRDHLWSIDIDRYNKINYNSDQKLLFSGQLGFSIQHDTKYIHQLQNLYFALTQKELIFNG